MRFNSLTFLVFLPVVFALYWFVFNRNLRLQNLFIVAASYVFYGWWDWRFLALIAFTSAWAYAFGLLDSPSPAGNNQQHGSRFLLALSCIVNLGILGYFKYYNFFIGQAAALLQTAGFQPNLPSLQVILPVGISFYTFQALSYTIDIYRRKIKPTKDPIAFFAFVSFFPQLVAGPIERASNLLPQFLRPRSFNYAQAVDGCRQMLWGFFKKMVIADGCAGVANWLFDETTIPNPGWVSYLVALFCFAIQIYGDFSGYSDIAIGSSKLFGIRLMKNFNCPYFSRDIAEFWRRWHISLTTWFRDYLYIPLGGSRCGTGKRIRNTFAIFLVSGLWHGANWTFIAWGFVHALLFLPLLLFGKNRKHLDGIAENRRLPSPKEALQIATTFAVVMLAWAFFRADSIQQAFAWLGDIARLKGGFSLYAAMSGVRTSGTFRILPWIAGMTAVEWFSRRQDVPLLPKARWARWTLYYLTIWAIFWWHPSPQSFIYFQF